MRILYAAIPMRDGYLPRALQEAGHVVETAADVAELLLMAGTGFDAALVESPTLVALPVARIAAAGRPASLVLVVDRAGVSERTQALRDGADACFVRPVQFMELEARLSALVRLGHGRGADESLTLDGPSRTARVDGRRVILSAREFAVLDYLAAHAGEVVSVEQVAAHVWGEAEEAGAERLRSTVARLRGRLSEALGRPLVATVRGHGYRLDPNMKQSSSD